MVDSENGLQAGVEATVLDSADFRGRIQYYEFGSFHRIDHFVFAAGWTGRHGLGMLNCLF